MLRMLRSTDNQYFLDLYAGIWNPHGTLYDESASTAYALKGMQKADQINLLAVSAEGMAAPNNETLSGELNANTGIMQANWNTSLGATSLSFEPAFKAADKPVVVFKFYGVDHSQYPAGKALTQVDVIDKKTNKAKYIERDRANGIVKNSNFERISARLNSSYKFFNDKLTHRKMRCNLWGDKHLHASIFACLKGRTWYIFE